VVVLAQTKVKEALEAHPELREVLLALSPRFALLNNPAIFDLVGRWATFADVARMGGLSVCEVLHRVNAATNSEEALFSHAPECLVETVTVEQPTAERPGWVSEANEVQVLDVRDRDDFFLPEVLGVLHLLRPGGVLKVVNSFYPAPLIEMLKEEGYTLHYERPAFHEHTLYIQKPHPSVGGWEARKRTFPEMDTAAWGKDFLSRLLQHAERLPAGEGFRLTVKMPPAALTNTLETLGLESVVEALPDERYAVYFYKPAKAPTRGAPALHRPVPLVIQSATPVVYPILMRLLESKRLTRAVRIEELKVWDKTEKHLGWIVNKKADISFSAVAAVAKLYQKGLDIKMTAIVVWDNFFILTRLPDVHNFGDLQGKSIHLPLIPAAPPAAVTRFLMQQQGYDPEAFDLVFGKPFGRPEEIKAMLVDGRAEVALLREPEASFAIYEGQGAIREAIAYRDIWRALFPGQGDLPNAGLLFAGWVLRERPEVAAMFAEETKAATQWVQENPEASAAMIAEVMGVPVPAAELFLRRAHLAYRPSSEMLEDITHYIDVLNKSGYGGKPFGEIRSLFV